MHWRWAASFAYSRLNLCPRIQSVGWKIVQLKTCKVFWGSARMLWGSAHWRPVVFVAARSTYIASNERPRETSHPEMSWATDVVSNGSIWGETLARLFHRAYLIELLRLEEHKCKIGAFGNIPITHVLIESVLVPKNGLRTYNKRWKLLGASIKQMEWTWPA